MHVGWLCLFWKCKMKSLIVFIYNKIESQRKKARGQDSNFLGSLQNITTCFLSLNQMFYSIYFPLTTIHIVSLCMTDVITVSDQTQNTVLRQFYFKVLCQIQRWAAGRDEAELLSRVQHVLR